MNWLVLGGLGGFRSVGLVDAGYQSVSLRGKRSGLCNPSMSFNLGRV